MDEYLQFNTLGQWTLHKSDQPPKDDYQPNGRSFRAYHGANMRGELPEDHSQRGTLRNFGGGKRPKPTWSPKTAARPARRMESAYNAHHPGVGD